MSQEEKKQAAAAEDQTPETVQPEEKTSDASAQEQPVQEKAEQPETETAKETNEKKNKDWFGKKNREDKAAEALKAKLDGAEKAAEDLKDKLLRTAAEYENFRKRSAREQEGAFNNGLSFAVEQLLPVLDTLEMAAKAPCMDENYKKGVEMTLTKAAAALTALKVEEISALGEPFDPNVMNAVQQAPAAEGQESGTVTMVYQKGYRVGERIIRHATVVVAE